MINIDLEYRFMHEVCKDQIDNKMKNIFLINSYVYPILDYMEIPTCDMNKKEKVVYLNELRDMPLFDRNVPIETLKKVRSKKRMYITMKLFYERKYKILIFIVGKGKSVLSVFRFKK